MVPLLCCKGWKRLERLPPIAGAPVENGVGIEIIRSGTGSNAGCREKFDAADLEKDRIFPAGDRQPSVLDEPGTGPAVEQHVDIAVAAVHVRRLAGNIYRELRNGQTQLPVGVKRQYRARARCGEALMLGKHWAWATI